MLVRLTKKFHNKQAAYSSVFLISATLIQCTSTHQRITLICLLRGYRLLILVMCSISDQRISRHISFILCTQIFVDPSLKKINQFSRCYLLPGLWNSVMNLITSIGDSSLQVVSLQMNICLIFLQIPLGYLRNLGLKSIVSVVSINLRTSTKTSMMLRNQNTSRKCSTIITLRKCLFQASQMRNLTNSISS